MNSTATIYAKKIAAATEQAVAFMHDSQLASGEFRSYFTTHSGPDAECILDSTVFPTALIAYSLAFNRSPKVSEMIDKTLPFFLQHMDRNGLWRYWTYSHQNYKMLPPDADDTSYISQLLTRYGVKFPENRRLLLANRNPKGLVYTWFALRWPVPPNLRHLRVVLKTFLNPIGLFLFFRITAARPMDVDGVVNANALFYLGISEETQKIVDYLISIVKNSEEDRCDKWYPSAFSFYYALSRNFSANSEVFESVPNELVARIERRANSDGSIGSNVLETALAACTLMNCGTFTAVLERAVEYLLQTQLPSGAWTRVAVYYGGSYGWGSEELTTGFCIECLSRFYERFSVQAAP